MEIVLNTSPIIFLSKVEALRLLADVSDEIYTPTAVVNELHEYTPPSFIEVVTVSATGAAYVQGALGRALRLGIELAAPVTVSRIMSGKAWLMIIQTLQQNPKLTIPTSGQ